MTGAKLLSGLEERFADVRSVRVRYYVGGDGPPLVLVHGLGGAAANWALLAPALAARRRLLVPDLPGHGGSSPLAAAPTLNPFADVVAALAQREGLGPAPVVGHSMGGVVALRLAIRHPGAVRAVVLAAPAGISSTARRAQYGFAVVSALKPARLVAPFRSAIARSRLLRAVAFGYWEASDTAALSPLAVEAFLSGPAIHSDVETAGWALLRDDPRTDLDRIACPRFVLWGARDHLVPVEDGIEYARRLGAPLRIVADCGHLLIGERPDACADAILAFVDGL
ncbi:MAG: alpha/beta fold hydrolase [Actinomycetota bacterium]|nr:alpha/beta fold hydrolase [Actinomycetota bacterium]